MIATVQGKYATLSHLMNERLKRRWAGCEALASGRGGISAVARATGMSPNTIKRGIREIEVEMPDLIGSLQRPERQRQPGGGRPRLAETEQVLVAGMPSELRHGVVAVGAESGVVATRTRPALAPG